MMNFKTVPNWVWLAGAAVVALYVIKKGGLQNAVADVTSATIDTAGSVASGVVVGVGEVVGIPRTNLTKCQQAIMKADNLDASKFCNATDFARWQYLSVRKRLFGTNFTMSDIFN